MYKGKTVLGVTLARGGSKSIHKKNIVDIAGKPLIKYTFDEVHKGTILDEYVVSTDAAVAQAGFLETYDMNASAGSDITGKSSATLDIGDTSADSATFRLLRVAEDPENEDITAARCSVVVVPNLIELQS